MKTVKVSELRAMSNDQLVALLDEAKDNLFRLRVQARMEKLDSPSELRSSKSFIARLLTLLRERELAK